MLERRKKEEENTEMRRKMKRQEGENEEIVGLWAKLQREGVRKRQDGFPWYGTHTGLNPLA